jgi:signal transduction histidine kinase
MSDVARSALHSGGRSPDFRALFESAPGLYLVLAPDLTIVAASDSYLRAINRQREQIVGRALLHAFPGGPGDTTAALVPNLGPSLRRVLETRAADTMAVQSFGERHWRPVNYPVIREGGEISFIVHRLEDVTELTNLQQQHAQDKKSRQELRTKATQLESTLFVRARELEGANEKLRSANVELSRLYQKAQEIYRLKTDLFASVSHELRTPLTLLLGPLDDLLRSPGSSIAASRSDLELMHRNSLRLLKLVNTLLDLARIEAGRLRGDYVPTDLTVLTADIANLFRSLVQKAGMKFDLQLEDLGQPVYVDRVMWEKIVLNLISNAFKFTSEGGISVALRSVGNCAQLTVTDTGIGIPESELPHIFERFFRGESAGARSLKVLESVCRWFMSLSRCTEGTSTSRLLWRTEPRLPFPSPSGRGICQPRRRPPSKAESRLAPAPPMNWKPRFGVRPWPERRTRPRMRCPMRRHLLRRNRNLALSLLMTTPTCGPISAGCLPLLMTLKSAPMVSRRWMRPSDGPLTWC